MRAKRELRLARVVRVATPAPVQTGGSSGPSPDRASSGVAVEFGVARVVMRTGFDRSTLAAVLDLLVERTQGRAR